MKDPDAARAVCLDASILVAQYTVEQKSQIIHEKLATESLRYTTPFCYFEAMNILKAKWKFQNKIDFPAYRESCSRLTAWFGGINRAGWVKDKNMYEIETFHSVRQIVDRTGLDFADAFQIYSVKSGYYSGATGSSTTLLATADNGLAIAARSEGLCVWDLINEP